MEPYRIMDYREDDGTRHESHMSNVYNKEVWNWLVRYA